MKIVRCLLIFVFIQSYDLFGESLRSSDDVFTQLQSNNAYSLFKCFDKKDISLVKLVPILLEVGSNPNDIIGDGETVLHKAISMAQIYEGYPIWKDYIKAIHLLVNSGADINAKYKGKTVLTLAFDLYLVTKWDEDQYTINGLHLAQILEPFLSAGFDPYSFYKIQSNSKKILSFFDVAVAYNFNEVVDLILGDNIINHHEAPFQTWNLSYIRKKISQGDDFSHYRLTVACPGGAYGSLSFLHKNQRKRCQVAVMILLENGFDPCKEQLTDEIMMTPLHIAAGLGSKEIIDLLIKNGADIEAKNAEGFTSLMLAAIGRRAESFSCLVHHGADLNIIVPKTNLSLKHYIQYGQFKDFFTDLRREYRGMEAIQLIMY